MPGDDVTTQVSAAPVDSQRLSSQDVGFLYVESPTASMHVGSVARFALPEGVGVEEKLIRRVVARRIAAVPRYRQRVRWVPGHLANPVWVDDQRFDIGYHVRRATLSAPGSEEQLWELVGRLQSRQLDRSHPLWELYVVDGLADGRLAVVTKTHLAMQGGIDAAEIVTLLLDESPGSTDWVDSDPLDEPGAWAPHREPTSWQLVTGALFDDLRRPTQVIDTVRSTVSDVRATTDRVVGLVGSGVGVALTAAGISLREAPDSPLNAPIGIQRRFATAATELADYRAVRAAHGGTVNDVVLATIAGAMRTWLLTRGESLSAATVLRAMAPVSVSPERQADHAAAAGTRPVTSTPAAEVSAYFVDLPVGEANAVVRLHRVSYAMAAHMESGRSISAPAISRLSGFAPPTVHAAAARLVSSSRRRLFNLVITNVPGPQSPLYAGNARLTDVYPVVPLAKGQAVAIGLISYDGGVYYGLNADRDLMPDIDVLAGCIGESLAELVAAPQ